MSEDYLAVVRVILLTLSGAIPALVVHHLWERRFPQRSADGEGSLLNAWLNLFYTLQTFVLAVLGIWFSPVRDAVLTSVGPLGLTVICTSYITIKRRSHKRRK